MDHSAYEKLYRELIQVIPEIKGAYDKERQWWGKEVPGPHIIFGDVLTPHLITLLEVHTDHEQLKRIFNFLEELSGREQWVQEVVQMSVCERLGDKKDWLAAAHYYMGNKTKRLCKEIEKFWGRENPGRF